MCCSYPPHGLCDIAPPLQRALLAFRTSTCTTPPPAPDDPAFATLHRATRALVSSLMSTMGWPVPPTPPSPHAVEPLDNDGSEPSLPPPPAWDARDGDANPPPDQLPPTDDSTHSSYPHPSRDLLMLSSDTDSDEPADDAPPLPSVHAQQPDLRRELSAPHTPTPLARPLRRLPTSAPHGRPSSPHVPSPPVPMSAPSRVTYLERATFISPYGLSARAAHFPTARSHTPQRDATLLTSPSPHELHFGQAAPPTSPPAAPLAEAASPAPRLLLLRPLLCGRLPLPTQGLTT